MKFRFSSADSGCVVFTLHIWSWLNWLEKSWQLHFGYSGS